MKRLALLCTLAIALPSCSGARSPLPLAAPNEPGAVASSPRAQKPVRHPRKVKVRIRIRVPAPHRAMRRALYRRLSESSATQGIETLVYAAGGGGLPLQTSAADIAPGSPNCVAAGSGRSCTFEIAAPPGRNEIFVFQTYNERPVSGAIPSSAKQIGAGVATQTVVEGSTTPTIAVTLGGVVATVALQVTPATLHTLIQSTATLQVFAYDADGNAIVGSYVDPDGNAISLSLSDSNVPCCISVDLNPTSLSSPSATGVQVSLTGTFTYAGGVRDVSIQAQPSGGPSSAASVNLPLFFPVFSHFYDQNLSTRGPFFAGAAYDNGNVFYTYNGGYASSSSAGGGVDYFDPATQNVSSISEAYTGPIAGGLAIGTGTYADELFVVGPTNLYTANAASPSSFSSASCGLPCGGSGSGVALDAGGNPWYGNGTQLVAAQSDGSAATSYAIGGTPAFGMAFDKLNHLWIADASAGGDVIYFDETTHAATRYKLPNPQRARAFDVIADAAGNIWVTDRGNDRIVEIDPTTLTTTNQYGVPTGTPWYLVQDPVQTNTFWFDYDNGGTVGVGRLDTLTNAVTQANDQNSYGNQPGAIVEANGLIFFPLDGGQTLDQVQP